MFHLRTEEPSAREATTSHRERPRVDSTWGPCHGSAPPQRAGTAWQAGAPEAPTRTRDWVLERSITSFETMTSAQGGPPDSDRLLTSWKHLPTWEELASASEADEEPSQLASRKAQKGPQGGAPEVCQSGAHKPISPSPWNPAATASFLSDPWLAGPPGRPAGGIPGADTSGARPVSDQQCRLSSRTPCGAAERYSAAAAARRESLNYLAGPQRAKTQKARCQNEATGTTAAGLNEQPLQRAKSLGRSFVELLKDGAACTITENRTSSRGRAHGAGAAEAWAAESKRGRSSSQESNKPAKTKPRFDERGAKQPNAPCRSKQEPAAAARPGSRQAKGQAEEVDGNLRSLLTSANWAGELQVVKVSSTGRTAGVPEFALQKNDSKDRSGTPRRKGPSTKPRECKEGGYPCSGSSKHVGPQLGEPRGELHLSTLHLGLKSRKGKAEGGPLAGAPKHLGLKPGLSRAKQMACSLVKAQGFGGELRTYHGYALASEFRNRSVREEKAVAREPSRKGTASEIMDASMKGSTSKVREHSRKGTTPRVKDPSRKGTTSVVREPSRKGPTLEARDCSRQGVASARTRKGMGPTEVQQPMTAGKGLAEPQALRGTGRSRRGMLVQRTASEEEPRSGPLVPDQVPTASLVRSRTCPRAEMMGYVSQHWPQEGALQRENSCPVASAEKSLGVAMLGRSFQEALELPPPPGSLHRSFTVTTNSGALRYGGMGLSAAAHNLKEEPQLERSASAALTISGEVMEELWIERGSRPPNSGDAATSEASFSSQTFRGKLVKWASGNMKDQCRRLTRVES